MFWQNADKIVDVGAWLFYEDEQPTALDGFTSTYLSRKHSALKQCYTLVLTWRSNKRK